MKLLLKHKVHPHKFRKTMATMAIDKGMPIEQVQKLLGHIKIDTTMEYAMVNQSNVKNSHRKYVLQFSKKFKKICYINPKMLCKTLIF